MAYEFQLVQGIPVYTKEGGVYTWDQSEQIRFGTLADGGRIEFDAEWEHRLAPMLASWREKSVQPRNRSELRNSRKNIGVSAK